MVCRYWRRFSRSLWWSRLNWSIYKDWSRINLSRNTKAISSAVYTPACLNTETTHTHIHLTTLFPGLPGWAGTRKVKPIWILLKQETVSGSGISWDICKSATRSRQITMPEPHHSVLFLQAGCPSCRPTNSVKALKAQALKAQYSNNQTIISSIKQ